jgi:hypothetical protein
MIAGQWNIDGLASLKQPVLDGQQNSSFVLQPIPNDMIETYRKLARFHFDCGDYQQAREIITNYISLHAKAPPPPSPVVSDNNSSTSNTGAGGDEDDEALVNSAKEQAQQQQQKQDDLSTKDLGNPTLYYLKQVDINLFHVLWGRLACDILVEDWSAASVAVEAVKTALEILAHNGTLSALEALQQRTWLLHWSLFVYWNDSSAKGGLEQLVELFHSDRYKQAITTNTPHLLRYLTAAVLLCKRRITKKAAAAAASGGSTEATSIMTARDNEETRRLIRNLVYVIQDCDYTDPIVEFVKCLCIKFDFDSAQIKLQECEQVLATDFFLCHQTSLFMEEARVFVFENYCRIHHKIELSTLSEKLAMSVDDTERWIVDLIRNADLDAKIDYHTTSSSASSSSSSSSDQNKQNSSGGCVVMGDNPQSIYEQVMDRTRDLNVRSSSLVHNLKYLLNDARREKMRRERAEQLEDE